MCLVHWCPAVESLSPAFELGWGRLQLENVLINVIDCYQAALEESDESDEEDL